jgi:ATP-dependent Zn protease
MLSSHQPQPFASASRKQYQNLSLLIKEKTIKEFYEKKIRKIIKISTFFPNKTFNINLTKDLKEKKKKKKNSSLTVIVKRSWLLLANIILFLYFLLWFWITSKN